MNFFTNSIVVPKIKSIDIDDIYLKVDLIDGRKILVPLTWYPRILYGKTEERNQWRLIGDGEGIHWFELDEDISVSNLLFGKPSGESNLSLNKWLSTRGMRSI